MKTVLCCNDSLIGIFSALYDAWKLYLQGEVCTILIKGETNQELFCDYQEVIESSKKVRAIENMVKKNLGYLAFYDIYYAAHSFDQEKGNAIFSTLKAASKLKDSRKIMDHLSCEAVQKVFSLSKNVGNEAHSLIEFLRFRELNNQVLFAIITPKNQVLTRIAPHFAERFPEENWLIYDQNHHLFALHEAKTDWRLLAETDMNDKALTNFSWEEEKYSQLWKEFTKTITIKERENKRCQRGHLPLKYRSHMTEFDSP